MGQEYHAQMSHEARLLLLISLCLEEGVCICIAWHFGNKLCVSVCVSHFSTPISSLSRTLLFCFILLFPSRGNAKFRTNAIICKTAYLQNASTAHCFTAQCKKCFTFNLTQLKLKLIMDFSDSRSSMVAAHSDNIHKKKKKKQSSKMFHDAP